MGKYDTVSKDILGILFLLLLFKRQRDTEKVWQLENRAPAHQFMLHGSVITMEGKARTRNSIQEMTFCDIHIHCVFQWLAIAGVRSRSCASNPAL